MVRHRRGKRMNTKNMTKEQALKELELLKSRIEFNNRLNKFVRAFRKEHNIGEWNDKSGKLAFNGYHDEPTEEMKDAMKDILINNSIMDISWMPINLKRRYASDTAAIFGQVYSAAVNTYVLKDLHDVEKFLATLDTATEKGNEDFDGLFDVERDTANNRLNLRFDYVPDAETRAILKSNGFKWSPSRDAWTRQLTDNAEKSLERIKRQLGGND